jgi:hypothetical protein
MGNKFERLKLALIASAAWFTPVTAEAGSITDYGFSNASAVLNGQPVTITGLVTDSFNGELSANVQVNGFGTVITYTLPFTDAGFQTPANTFIIGNLVIHYANAIADQCFDRIVYLVDNERVCGRSGRFVDLDLCQRICVLQWGYRSDQRVF